MKKNRHVLGSRRRFLKSLGLAAGAGTLGSLVPLLDREVAEASGDGPLRFVVFYTPNGTVLDEWTPQGGETDFRLGQILSPLEEFRSQMTILGGIANESCKHGKGNGHARAGVGLLTATGLTKSDGEPGAGTAAGGPSVDHLIAQRVSDGTPFESLQLGTNNRSQSISYSARERPNPMAQNPVETFSRIFAGVGDPESAGPDPATVRRRRILDSLAGQSTQLRDAVGSDARDKLEAHLGAIESIEDRLTELETRPDTCVAPDIASGGSYLEKGKLNLDIAASALACDLTRVVTLQYGVYGGVRVAVPEAGIGDGEYHEAGHQHRRDSSAYEKMLNVKKIYARHLRDFARQLQSTPEGDGTLLDNTLILWCTSLEDGSHRWDNMPYLMLGGANHGVRGGRYLQYSGVNHNQLLTSCCNLMGLDDVDRFGDPEYGTGALPRLI